MAWLDKRGQTYRVVFQIGGRTFKRSLETTNQREAMGRLSALEQRIKLVERGDLVVPEDIDLLDFLLQNGKPKPVLAIAPLLKLSGVISDYLDSIPENSLEENSLCTLRVHLRHVERILGADFRIEKLTFNDLQRYVDDRSHEMNPRGRHINTVTIRKELTSCSGLWSWLRRTGKCQGEFPNRGLRYPKTSEKPRFQTWTEIERQISRRRLTEVEQDDLWANLYLTCSEIHEVLSFVETNHGDDWFYPMLLMAAHTGARRSELIRSEVSDFDFEGGMVQIREKKRVKGKSSCRTVPLTPQLRSVMVDWFRSSAGRFTFHVDEQPLSVDDASGVFDSVFSESKWSVLKGWHVFRHSFISNCASRGVDQRMIDAWVGHTTEDMRRRYRHLLPDAQQAALASVFGKR